MIKDLRKKQAFGLKLVEARVNAAIDNVSVPVEVGGTTVMCVALSDVKKLYDTAIAQTIDTISVRSKESPSDMLTYGGSFESLMAVNEKPTLDNFRTYRNLAERYLNAVND